MAALLSVAKRKCVMCKEHLHATSTAGYVLILTAFSVLQIISPYNVVFKI